MQSATARANALPMPDIRRVPTGRGSWVPCTLPLEEILRRYDLAFPDFVDISRQEVINAYHEVQQ